MAKSPKEVVIALDQGSSSSRALAFDCNGRVAARAQVPVKTFRPRKGWVEHDSLELAKTQEAALDAVLDKLPPSAQVLGLGMAAQRSTVVLWDSETGKPAGRALSWQDARAAGQVAGLQQDMERQQDVHTRTGLYLMPFYAAPKIRYQIENLKQARALAGKGRLRAGPISTFILWRLTRGESFLIDPAMAQRMLLFNIGEQAWDESLLALFGISPSCLPEVVPTAGSWGHVARKGRRIPVLAVMGDQQSAALGQGVESSGSGVLNYGTGSFCLVHTGAERRGLPGLLTSAAWRREARACDFFLEGTVNATGPAFEWLKTRFGFLRDVKAVEAACRRSKNRLFALQALGGLGAPRWDVRTPSVFWGLDPSTEPADVVRAVMESTAFLIADIIDPMRGAGLGLTSLRATGGLARIDSLLQFQADLLQQPILRLKEREATALGAASLAAEQAGAPWAAAMRTNPVDREFKPKMPEEKALGMKMAWRRFVEVQQMLARELSEKGLL